MIFDKQTLIELIDEFYQIYKKRPIQNNEYGMRSPQLFGLFCYLKIKKPKLIFESGVYRGQGTWLIRQTLPDSQIICIEPNLPGIYYRDTEAIYFNKDITSFEISEVISKFSSDEILIFFDDHQDFDKRLPFLIQNNIENIIFEDNYPPYAGDCLSPKKLIENSSEIDPNLIRFIESYEEFPPIYNTEVTGWGETASNFKYLQPLIEDSSLYPILWEERQHYYWICYVKIKIK
jgi:hypothetical protein